MKNDIILFVVMFAVAWLGFGVVKDRLHLPATESATPPSKSLTPPGIGDTPEAVLTAEHTKEVTSEHVTSLTDVKQEGSLTKQASSSSATPDDGIVEPAKPMADVSSEPAKTMADKISEPAKPMADKSSESAKPMADKKSEPAKSAATKQTSEQVIEQVLLDQTKAWNRGDLDGFMDSYWNSEDLTFSGGGETTEGWQATYNSYQERYPKGEMGQIEFKDLRTEMVGKESAIVTGRFNHQLGEEKARGNFSLVFKLIDDQWKIIHDHTSMAN